MMHQKSRQKLPFFKKLLYIFVGFCVGLAFFLGLRAFQYQKAEIIEEPDIAVNELSDEDKATLNYDHS
ncbi:MAG: hypothetical protein AB7I18_11960 [Candidatus Berkiella sp.]